MSKSVRGLMTSLKRREPLPRVDGEVPSDINKSLRPTRSFSEKVSQVVRLRKAGKSDEIQALKLVSAYADIIVRVEAEPDGVPNMRRKQLIEGNFKKHLLNLDALLLRLKIPTILYLRVHARMNNPIRVHWLATSSAVNEFTDWVENDAKPRFSAHEDLREYLEHLATWDTDDHLKRLLEEWHYGHTYLDNVLGDNPLIDKTTAALVEMHLLPGGCLVTFPEIVDMYHAFTLPSTVHERVELSLSLLGIGDNRQRFQTEILKRSL